MAAIVRVKRRREEDAVDSLVFLCKKSKGNQTCAAEKQELEESVKSTFKFAGTVSAKDGSATTHCVRQAIRKGKLEKCYKLPERRVDKSKTDLQSSHHSSARYKIVAERRALDFNSLSVDSVAVKTESPDSKAKPDIACECTQTNSERLFRLYDVERLQTSKSNDTTRSEDVVTCNGVPMIREAVVPVGRVPTLAVPESLHMPGDEDDKYVYDLYYINDSKFDFNALENVVAVESNSDMADPFLYGYTSSDSEDEQGYDDEDDENAESNWRNDYPDDDPMYFEKLDLNDHYYSSNDDEVDDLYGDDEDKFGYMRDGQ